MTKEYSFKSCKIQVDYTPDFSYINALYGHCEISRLIISNTSRQNWDKLTLSVTSYFFKPQIRIYTGVQAGNSIEICLDPLDINLDKLYHINSDFSAEIILSVSDDKETYGKATLPIKIFTRTHFSGKPGRYAELAAFVNPSHKIVKSIVANITVIKPDSFNEFSNLRKCVENLYDAVKDYGISYRDTPFIINHSQDISTSDIISRMKQGNSLDIALLLCSCFEHIGVRSCLICFNSNVIVGAWTENVPEPDYAVVESAENIYDHISSDHPNLVVVDPSGIVSGKDFEDANYSANRLILNEEPHYLIDIAGARLTGIKPIPDIKPKCHNNSECSASKFFQPFILNESVKQQKFEDIDIRFIADSFQTEALSKAANGISFILNATSATEREKMVAGIIANAVCNDKSVLYVASDEIVKEKVSKEISCLKSVGLCDDTKFSDDLDEKIAALNEEYDAVYRAAKDNMSLYDAIERYYSIDGYQINFPAKEVVNINSYQAEEISDILQSFDDIHKILGKHPSKLPLVGIYPRVKTNRGQARIEAFLEEFPRFLKRAKRHEHSLINNWFFHRDAMSYLDKIEQWNTFRRLVIIDESITVDIDTVAAAIDRWHRSKDLFDDWTPFADAVVQLNKLGALKCLEYYLEGHSGKETADAFLKGYFYVRALNVLQRSNVLNTSNGIQFSEKIESCHMAIDRRIKANCKKFASATDCNYSLSTISDLDCNNLSHYDLLIIDDANRIKTTSVEDLIKPASQIIFVGDSRTAEPASLISDALKSGITECKIPYQNHYRHEDSVNFINRTFYRGELITYPSIDNVFHKISFVDSKGIFDNETGCNIIEARTIINKITDIFYKANGSDIIPYIGVIALCREQKLLLHNLWDKVSVPDKIRYNLFIKDINELRGDEKCDIAIISICFAPDQTGRISLESESLCLENGERLVNMAISCAKYELQIFSSLKPVYIPEDEAIPYGLRVLRSLLAYAIDPTRLDEIKEVSAIVGNISEELSARGYIFDLNVGHSICKIDIAVKDPDTNLYSLGIIVDGKNYTTLPSVIDRDIIVPQMLTSLGWKIKRIRAVDWFRNKESVLTELLH